MKRDFQCEPAHLALGGSGVYGCVSPDTSRLVIGLGKLKATHTKKQLAFWVFKCEPAAFVYEYNLCNGQSWWTRGGYIYKHQKLNSQNSCEGPPLVLTKTYRETRKLSPRNSVPKANSGQSWVLPQAAYFFTGYLLPHSISVQSETKDQSPRAAYPTATECLSL